jgi:hypothetical protein
MRIVPGQFANFAKLFAAKLASAFTTAIFLVRLAALILRN